jgi:uncharacterized repeat protein (TIGR04076 family)
MKRYMGDVIARVISQEGTCVAGHGVGDEFVIGQETPPGMCSWAFYTLFPFAEVLQFGGSFPWEEDRSRTTVACPDPANPVVFELSRSPLQEKTAK